MTMSILHHKPNQKKVGFKLSLLLLPVLFSFLFSCRYQVPESSLKAVSQKTKDSVDYLPEHYYTLNSNFEVTSDSLLLQQLPLIDVLPVYKGEKLVVAEFMVQAADTVDSVWVKVARDQETMGWVREGELLKKVVPVDPISQFIHLFSSSHTVAFFVILALFGMGYLYRAVRKKRLQLIWFNDIDSISKVEFALLETNGSLSIIPKDQCVVELPDALICDGIIDEDNLKLLNRDINWLKKELKKQGVDKIEDVFYCVPEKGHLLVIKK